MEDVESVSFGRSCTRGLERLSASLGALNEAAVKFECCGGVSFGGVLFALPALLFNGLLLKSREYFRLPRGYYGLDSILLTLAFLVLLRVKSLEGVRYMPPGELGKLVGLDRIPEVKTLREKIELFKRSGNVGNWQSDLSAYWLESFPGLSGYLYVDGHVRVYFGKQTKLPRRYVSRERLCLRGMTDYWVNDALGQPFFVVPTALTSGLLSMLRTEIIPRLLKDVPNQPSEKELEEDLFLHRFSIIFDREGYSTKFFEEMFFQHRIACITYKKYPGEDWPEENFKKREVMFKNGEKVAMLLAEEKLVMSELYWVREIRRLTPDGHQTAILTTNYKADTAEIAAAMFQRWSQENFFKYMLEHYGIDRLIEYETQDISDTARVVNPEYREINKTIKKANTKLQNFYAEFGSKTLNIDEDENVEKYQEEMAGLQEKIIVEMGVISRLKQKRKAIPSHLEMAQLPKKEIFATLATEKKMFMDTVKMIAYRAETAMANIIRPHMARKEEARCLIRRIFNTEVNLIPDETKKQLIVELHNLTTEHDDKLAEVICDELNQTSTVFPGTDFTLFYKMVSQRNRRSQEV